MKKGARETEETARKQLAGRIAKAVVDCDPSILSLLVVDSRGEVLAIGRSGRLARANYIDEDLLPKLGVLSKLILGAADQESGMLGGLEFLIGAFKNQKIVLIEAPDHKMSLALRMSRSSIAEYVCKKIADILSTIE